MQWPDFYPENCPPAEAEPASGKVLGRLEIVETYAYYDEPILFSCKDAENNLYLVVAADENDQYETWLYAEVSAERLNSIRSGTIDLYNAFVNTENGYLLQVKFPYDQTEPSIESVQSHRISEDMLPIPGERLDFETDLPLVLSKAEEIAISKNQEILDIGLNTDNQ